MKLVVSPRAWALGLLLIAIAVVLVGVASHTRQLPSLRPTPFPTATARPFAPAKEGEAVIVVADFDNRSEGNYAGIEPAQNIYDQLDERAKKDNLPVRVEHLHGVLNEQSARPTGEIYSATLLVWGWYDGLSVQPVIERIRKTTNLRQAGVEVLSIADPNTIEPVITGDWPNQGAYLTLLTLGLDQYATNNFTETLRYYNMLISSVGFDQIAPSNRGEVYFWRGLVYFQKGDDGHAIADFTQAIQLKPDLAQAYYNRGLAYDHQGDKERAISDYAEAYDNRGLAYYAKGNYDQAIVDYTQAIKLRPDLAHAYNNRGLAYYAKGNYDQAMVDYTQAIQLQPDLAQTYYNRGNAYYIRSHYDQAIVDYTQAIQLKPDYAKAYYNRGLAYYQQGDTERATADFKKTFDLSLDPTLRLKAAQSLDQLGMRP